MQEHRNEGHEGGMTLAELLVAIVVVGVLAAIAIIGFSGLNDTSSDSACKATAAAATSASAAFYTRGHAYPQTFPELTNPPAGKPWLEASNMTETATTLKGRNGWTLQLIPGATPDQVTTFSC